MTLAADRRQVLEHRHDDGRRDSRSADAQSRTCGPSASASATRPRLPRRGQGHPPAGRASGRAPSAHDPLRPGRRRHRPAAGGGDEHHRQRWHLRGAPPRAGHDRRATARSTRSPAPEHAPGALEAGGRRDEPILREVVCEGTARHAPRSTATRWPARPAPPTRPRTRAATSTQRQARLLRLLRRLRAGRGPPPHRPRVDRRAAGLGRPLRRPRWRRRCSSTSPRRRCASLQVPPTSTGTPARSLPDQP